MPNVTTGGFAGGNDDDRTHVLPNDTAAEDFEFLEAMLHRHTEPSMFLMREMEAVIPDFKDKTRYAPYVSFRSQTSHIATNKG